MILMCLLMLTACMRRRRLIHPRQTAITRAETLRGQSVAAKIGRLLLLPLSRPLPLLIAHSHVSRQRGRKCGAVALGAVQLRPSSKLRSARHVGIDSMIVL